MAKNPKADNPEEFSDLFDPTYRGNIFGWKVSFIGLFVIVFFAGLAVYRHKMLNVSLSGKDVPQAVKDSLYNEVRDTIIKHPLD